MKLLQKKQKNKKCGNYNPISLLVRKSTKTKSTQETTNKQPSYLVLNNLIYYVFWNILTSNLVTKV